MSVGAEFSLQSSALRDFPHWYAGSDSRKTSRAVVRLGLGGTGALRADISAGMRNYTGGGTEPVGGARISLGRGSSGLWMSWRRESGGPIDGGNDLRLR